MSFPWREERHKKQCSRNIIREEKDVSKPRWLGGEAGWKMVPGHVWAGLMSSWMPSKFLVAAPMLTLVISSISLGLSSHFVVGHAWMLVSPSLVLALMWPNFILASGMRRLVSSLTSTSGTLTCSIPIIGQVWTNMLPTLCLIPWWLWWCFLPRISPPHHGDCRSDDDNSFTKMSMMMMMMMVCTLHLHDHGFFAEFPPWYAFSSPPGRTMAFFSLS